MYGNWLFVSLDWKQQEVKKRILSVFRIGSRGSLNITIAQIKEQELQRKKMEEKKKRKTLLLKHTTLIYSKRSNETEKQWETLWSTVNGIACVPRQSTALESPQLAAIIWQAETISTKAVDPTNLGAIASSLKAWSAVSYALHSATSHLLFHPSKVLTFPHSSARILESSFAQ